MTVRLERERVIVPLGGADHVITVDQAAALAQELAAAVLAANIRAQLQRQLATSSARGPGCRECGHYHEGPQFGGICIGCPCEWRP